ncbi:MAG: hypothetical protein Q8O89_02960 [Nanoarchaeota archaeon]|nr:hypothetical protein [Nanoarchaeota archaeon]
MGIISNIKLAIETRRKTNRVHIILNQVMEDFDRDFYDCNSLAGIVEEKLSAADIPCSRIIIRNAENNELGHKFYKNQMRHEVIEVFGRIFDPYSPRLMKLEAYLTDTYHQPNKLEVKVMQN